MQKYLAMLRTEQALLTTLFERNQELASNLSDLSEAKKEIEKLKSELAALSPVRGQASDGQC